MNIKFILPYGNQVLEGNKNGYDVQIHPCLDSRKDPFAFPEATDVDHYLQSVADIASYHKSNGGKTVFSRVITGYNPGGIDIDKACAAYFKNNPHAFRMYLHHPEYGTWIIATPELLLSVRGGVASTMALAGTRRAGKPDEPWDSKNREEQRMVTDFIMDAFRNCGLAPDAGLPYTFTSNDVEHIRTDITATVPEGFDVKSLLEVLSPTPAVCGLPRADALRNISKYEKHARGLYTGYAMVTFPDGSIEAYVILRCARILDNGHFALYAGGGITAMSNPALELEETEIKCHALKHILLS